MESKKSAPLWTQNFALITLINLFVFFSFQVLLPTLPLYVKSLGGTNSIIGFVTGCFILSALIARPLSGRLLDIVGRRPVFLTGLCIIIFVILLYGWLPMIGFILMLRLIHGLGWGASSTASSTIASDNIPRERFAEGMGYFSLTSSLAMALAPAVGLYVISKYSFSMLFYLSTGLAVIAALLTGGVKYRRVEKKEPLRGLASLFEPSSIRPSIVVFFVTITYGSLTSFLPLYAAQQGIQNIGLFFTVYAATLLISRPVFGKVVDRFGFDYAILPGLGCIFAAMLLLSQSAALPLFLLDGFLYGIGFGAVQSSLNTMAVADTPPHRFGAANATFLTAFDSGIGLGAVLLGAVSSSVGFSQMYLWAAISPVIALILYFAIARKKPAAKESKPAN